MGLFFMSEDDLKMVIEAYQRKSFELFNQNIVLEVQLTSLKNNLEKLILENEKLKKSKKAVKPDDEF